MNNLVTIGVALAGAVSVAVLLYYFFIKSRGGKQDDATVAVVGLTDIQATPSTDAEVEIEQEEPEQELAQNFNIDTIPLFTPLPALVRAKPLR